MSLDNSTVLAVIRRADELRAQSAQPTFGTTPFYRIPPYDPKKDKHLQGRIQWSKLRRPQTVPDPRVYTPPPPPTSPQANTPTLPPFKVDFFDELTRPKNGIPRPDPLPTPYRNVSLAEYVYALQHLMDTCVTEGTLHGHLHMQQLCDGIRNLKLTWGGHPPEINERLVWLARHAHPPGTDLPPSPDVIMTLAVSPFMWHVDQTVIERLRKDVHGMVHLVEAAVVHRHKVRKRVIIEGSQKHKVSSNALVDYILKKLETSSSVKSDRETSRRHIMKTIANISWFQTRRPAFIDPLLATVVAYLILQKHEMCLTTPSPLLTSTLTSVPSVSPSESNLTESFRGVEQENDLAEIARLTEAVQCAIHKYYSIGREGLDGGFVEFLFGTALYDVDVLAVLDGVWLGYSSPSTGLIRRSLALQSLRSCYDNVSAVGMDGRILNGHPEEDVVYTYGAFLLEFVSLVPRTNNTIPSPYTTTKTVPVLKKSSSPSKKERRKKFTILLQRITPMKFNQM